MKKYWILFILLGLIVLSSSAFARDNFWPTKKNVTATFLGSGAELQKIKMSLADTMYWSGGRDITVNGDGKSTVVTVWNDPTKKPRGFYRKEYELNLTNDEVKKIIDLFIENDFLTLKIKERQGVPDEPHPVITLTNANGESRALMKWEGDKVERFDNIYAAFLALEQRAKATKPLKDTKF